MYFELQFTCVHDPGHNIIYFSERHHIILQKANSQKKYLQCGASVEIFMTKTKQSASAESALYIRLCETPSNSL